MSIKYLPKSGATVEFEAGNSKGRIELKVISNIVHMEIASMAQDVDQGADMVKLARYIFDNCVDKMIIDDRQIDVHEFAEFADLSDDETAAVYFNAASAVINYLFKEGGEQGKN